MTSPVSTYRLQFQPGFGFDDAAEMLDYLRDLGVSHVYSSPYLQAAPGSLHGYDVVDHAHVNRELGGEDAFQRFVARLKEMNLGQILDIVPNHMAIPGRENAWWWDVLCHGIKSPYASYFDIDWRGSEEKLHGLVLVPILGDHYARVLERGEIRVEKSEYGDVVLRYFENEFPVDEETFDGDIDAVNADIDKLDALVQKQHYRLAYWRVATDELDYRRFFDVNTLVALRMDREEVFSATHERIIGWVREGALDGVRVDHVDGLLDPVAYLRRLRRAIGDDAYVLVEKILKVGERLSPSWPVAGTTGYDLLAYVDGLFIEPNGEEALQRVLVSFTGDTQVFDHIVRDGKTYVVDRILRSDVDRLSGQFASLAEHHRVIRDYTSAQFHDVVRAMLIAFPVYRTYCVAASRQQTQADVDYVTEAQALVMEINPEIDVDLLQFFCDVLTLRIGGSAEGDLAMRFQQTTGPVMAKGMEDTAFYRALRLTSLNEVGNNPGRFAVRPDDFHAVCSETQRLWPQTMIASTTHDTKRSEDVRYRLHVLSEIPDLWQEAVERWSAMNDVYRRPVESADPTGEYWPARHDEYLLYQTLVGAFPLSVERAVQYMQKASKEAKVETSWVEPNAGYDAALQSFIESTFSNDAFMDDVQTFVDRMLDFGRLNSLSATVVKLTMPGVPDVFQGTELWTLTLVDPDNRNPVDFAQRRELLRSLDGVSAKEVLQHMDEGLPKLFVMYRLLQLRQEHPEWFDDRAIYDPLWSSGQKSANVLAFQRGELITVVPRLSVSLQGDWSDTTIALPPGKWCNVFTGDVVSGGDVALDAVFALFPVGVFVMVKRDQADV